MINKTAKIIVIFFIGAFTLAACSSGGANANKSSQPHWKSLGLDRQGGGN